MAKENAIEMYSKHNEGKYVVAERFIRNLKNKSYERLQYLRLNTYQKIRQYS